MTSGARLRILLYIVVALQFSALGRLVPLDTLLDGAALAPSYFSLTYADVAVDRRLSDAAPSRDESRAAIRFDRLVRRVVDPSASIKVFLYLSFFLAPILIFGASRFFGFEDRATAVALLLTTAGSLGHDIFSRGLIFGGHISFWLGAHVALFNAAALFAWAFHGSRWGGPCFLLTFPFLLLLNPTLALIQFAPLGAMLVIAPKGRRLGVAAWIALGGVTAAVVNASWLGAHLMSLSYAVLDIQGSLEGLRNFALSFVPWGEGALGFVWSFVRTSVFIFGWAELMALHRGKYPAATILLSWATLLLVGTCFGDTFRVLAGLQRQAFPLMLLLSLPASAALADIFLQRGTFRLWVFCWSLWLMASWQAVYDHEVWPMRTDSRLLTNHVHGKMHDPR